MVAISPVQIADHSDRVGVAAYVLGRLKPATKNRMDSEDVEIVRRYDAAGGPFGAIPYAKRGPEDAIDDKCIN